MSTSAPYSPWQMTSREVVAALLLAPPRAFGSIGDADLEPGTIDCLGDSLRDDVDGSAAADCAFLTMYRGIVASQSSMAAMQLLALTATQSEVASATLAEAVLGSALLQLSAGDAASLSLAIHDWSMDNVESISRVSALGWSTASSASISVAAAATGTRIEVDPDSTYEGQSGILAALSRTRLSESAQANEEEGSLRWGKGQGCAFLVGRATARLDEAGGVGRLAWGGAELCAANKNFGCSFDRRKSSVCSLRNDWLLPQSEPYSCGTV